MINKNEHNTVVRKAVPCDLKAEIFKLRDKILENKETHKNYEYYREYFENYNKTEYSIGACIEFIFWHSDLLEFDIYIRGCERALSYAGRKLQGITKLPNGADIIIFQVYSEEHWIGMCQVLYYDGTQLRLFTPYEGNAVNIITTTCIGDEWHACDSTINKTHPLAAKIYPRGISAEIVEEDIDAAKNQYLRYYGISKEDAEDDCVDLDWDAIEKEIISTLS